VSVSLKTNSCAGAAQQTGSSCGMRHQEEILGTSTGLENRSIYRQCNNPGRSSEKPTIAKQREIWYNGHCTNNNEI